MAKQRRPAQIDDDQRLRPTPRTQPRSARAGAAVATGTPAVSPGPQRRSTYYRSRRALRTRARSAAAPRLSAGARACSSPCCASIPRRSELHERVRLYLNICQRQATQREAAPQTIDERLYAATLAINGGRYDEAISHLRLVRDEDPDNDHALYMLAVAHAQRGEHAEAVAHLERAIALNPENRALARTDPDLEPLRDDEAFRAALEAPSGVRAADRRRPIKTRSAR